MQRKRLDAAEAASLLRDLEGCFPVAREESFMANGAMVYTTASRTPRKG